MSRTWRFCNKRHSPLFEHPYKFHRYHCKCDYCIDPKASRHRRMRNKLEVERELANLYVWGEKEIKKMSLRKLYSWN